MASLLASGSYMLQMYFKHWFVEEPVVGARAHTEVDEMFSALWRLRGCKMRQNVIQGEWAQHTRRTRRWERIVWHWGLRGIRQESLTVGSKGTKGTCFEVL